jgi:hypothetical protein
MGLFAEPLTASEGFLLMRSLHPGHLTIEHLHAHEDAGDADAGETDAGEADLDHVRADILRMRFAGVHLQDRRG